jgi:hypothetical protein
MNGANIYNLFIIIILLLEPVQVAQLELAYL